MRRFSGRPNRPAHPRLPRPRRARRHGRRGCRVCGLVVVRGPEAQAETEGFPRARLIDVATHPQLPTRRGLACEPGTIQAGDIVGADVGNRTFLHRVSDVDPSGAGVEIADARGRVNGWTKLRRNRGHLRRDRRPADPRRECGRPNSRRLLPEWAALGAIGARRAAWGTSEDASRKREGCVGSARLPFSWVSQSGWYMPSSCSECSGFFEDRRFSSHAVRTSCVGAGRSCRSGSSGDEAAPDLYD